MILGLVLAALAHQAGREPFELPAGFHIARALEASHSFLALTFDDQDRLLVATEAHGILRATDSDGDGFFEALEPLAPELVAAQGLCVLDDALYAVARRETEEGLVSGLWRCAYPDPGAAPLRRLLAIEDDDEHGAHGIVVGPDGDLWLTLGDQARIAAPPPSEPFARRDAPPFVPALADPTGFGLDARHPFGQVLRVDPQSGAWRTHSGGYRNAYDLAFTSEGDLFLVDSDMEWDRGLPWYRPTRLLLALPEADFGYRPGSRVIPAGVADIAPAVLELGPGSPTGIVCYEHEAFPERYRGALLSADWARGAVDALFLEREGAGFRATREPLITAHGPF